jgi:ubiquitin-activating enzyme E1
MHVDFILAASNLMAYVYAIPQVTDRHQIIREVDRIQVPKFEYKSDSIDIDTNISIDRLPKSNEYDDIQIQPHQLKIDDDSNFQLDYIMIMANLRAQNYDLESTDRSEVKRIVGGITPAIVTTTALVAGLASLEIYKLVQKHKNIEYFKNSFINMGLSCFVFCEPMPVKRQQVCNDIIIFPIIVFLVS